MQKFFRHLFTSSDNKTYDLGCILWAQMGIAFVAVSGWAYSSGHASFDPVAWGGGAAAILAGGAGGLKLKQSTEPNGGQNAGTSD